MPPRARLAVLVVVCLAPVCFSLPALSQPYGTAEDGLNPAIWGLGARNLLALGFAASKRGALVAPYPGTTGNGIYAHHPPLPVWLMTGSVALGGWEGWARLFALGCAASSLWLLARLLAKFFEPGVALLAVAATACCGYLLTEGRLFNTLTVATPLYLALLEVTLASRLEDRRWPWWTLPVLVALVLSSWDGVLGAAVLLASLTSSEWRAGSRLRALAPGAVGLVTVLFVAWHLVDATGGTRELGWQLAWRAGGSEFTWAQWLAQQGSFLSAGLGPLTLLLGFAAPAAWAASRGERRALLLFALAAAPGVLMTLGFRQGAHRHAFWGYALILPAAVALAMALTLARKRSAVAFRVLVGALVLQAGWSAYRGVVRLLEQRDANSVGALVARRFRGSPAAVPMLTHYNYHPYVTWNARARPDWALSTAELLARVEDGRWSPGAEVLVDADFAGRLGCRVFPTLDESAEGRWVLTTAAAMRVACGPVGR